MVSSRRELFRRIRSDETIWRLNPMISVTYVGRPLTEGRRVRSLPGAGSWTLRGEADDGDRQLFYFSLVDNGVLTPRDA
jgi:hypothetical protein